MRGFCEQAARAWIKTFKNAHYRGADRNTLSTAERRILELLVGHGAGRRTLQPPASSKWIAGELGMDPSSASRVLRRLGTCGFVVNLGRGRSMDLAINTDLTAWDAARLRSLRKARGSQIKASLRNP